MKTVWKSTFTVLALFFATAAFSQVDVLTQHNNVSRTGWNDAETKLNISNVKTGSFGLLGSHTVDNQIYAQPLVVSGVIIGGTSTNVVYVATENNTIYAFDAENAKAPVIWQRNLTNAGNRPVYNTDMGDACGGVGHYRDFTGVNGLTDHGYIGIVGTPVIDKASNTMWLVHREVDPTKVQAGDYSPTGFRQFLHAIDIRTGAEKAGSPVQITAVAAGPGPGNVAGVITFDSRKENQRGGLLLMNGAIYIPYAAHCDWDNYYGWVIAYDAASLQQRTAWISGPNDSRGGIWMSGAGITADPNANGGLGSLYVASGNSYNADPSILENRGESITRLDPNGSGTALTKLKIADYFTPTDYKTLNALDLDFGTQTMLVPGSNILVAGCKNHFLYVFNRTSLGGYNTTANQIVDSFYLGGSAGMHTSFAYFGGSAHKYFYQLSENTNLTAFPVTTNNLGAAINGVGNGPSGQAGAMLATSSNLDDEATGILWISQAKPGCDANQESCDGVLRAVNAVDINSELWNSTQTAADEVGVFTKNACPTIANGKVYLPSLSNKLNIYGLLDNNPLCKTNVALAKTYSESGGDAANAGNAFDGNTGTSWVGGGAADWVQVDLGAAYDICKVSLTWASVNDAGKDFKLEVANNLAGPWTTIETVTGNTGIAADYSGTYPSSRYVRFQGVTFGIGGEYDLAELGVFGTISATCTPPTGLTTANITQNGATVNWTPVAVADSYLLRYKPSAISSWITRTTSNPTQALSQLSCGSPYQIDVQSVCAASSSSFAEVTMSTSDCTTPCALPTRYSNADIGDIGVAGSSCYDDPTSTFTVKGSGNISGTNDRFQFGYTHLAGDEVFVTQAASLSNLPGAKGGLMMRDSVSNTAAFAYLSFTNGSGIQFLYRKVSGAPTTTVQGPMVTLPYYLQLQKIGSVYTVLTSPNKTVWTQFASIDLGFGAAAVYPGIAVTSSDNTQLATGTFADYSESAPLPVTLLNFTAKNINNQFVLLNWSTSMEENNKEFVLEHSPDGVTFATLTTIKASGDSDTLRKYSAVDNMPFNGANYYRLVQYDLDGRATTLPVVTVTFGTNTSPVIKPNPIADFVNIFGGDEVIKSAALYDVTGKKIRETVNSGGDPKVQIPANGVARGVYVVKIITTTKTYQQKVIKR